jgi:hypothetical protein
MNEVFASIVWFVGIGLNLGTVVSTITNWKKVEFLLLEVSFTVRLKIYVPTLVKNEIFVIPPVELMLKLLSFIPNVTKLTKSVPLISYENEFSDSNV